MTGKVKAESINKKLDRCQEVLQYQFRDRELLRQCLTHASVAKTRLESNERLEFLGDAILGAVVCEMLYHRFPDFLEGEMTRIKSVLVSRSTCALVCDEMGLTEFLILGKGLAMHDTVPRSILAGVFEAVIAGIYLDGGNKVVWDFLERSLEAEFERATDAEQMKNFKSMLQQLAQKVFGETPVYRMLDEKGPDHSKCFKVSAVVALESYPAAWGASKKEAEQRAAQNALCQIDGVDVPYASD